MPKLFIIYIYHQSSLKSPFKEINFEYLRIWFKNKEYDKILHLELQWNKLLIYTYIYSILVINKSSN